MQQPRRGLFTTIGCGLGMGLADAVPGVSGGTVLLVAGVLDHYLASLAAVLAVLRQPLHRERWREAGRALLFLMPLIAAQATALIAGVLMLVGKKPELGASEASARAALSEASGLLVNPGTAPVVFAIFFTLVAVSLREPWMARRSHRGLDWVLAGLGALIAGGMALSPAVSGTPGTLAILIGGAVAISVMILPGISGSLALLLMGLYQPISAAVHARDVVTLATFVGGIAIGLAVAVPALRALLARAHDRTMAFLTGLMAGSLLALWPWKAHYFPEAIPVLGPMRPLLPQGAWWWPVLAAVLAGVSFLLALRLARQRRPTQTGTATVNPETSVNP